jgi:quinol monooxygenase YgiN
MPAISVTRLRVRKWRYLPSFIIWSLRSAAQAKKAPGNLGVALLRDQNNTYWTKTVWKDEGAVKAYMVSEPHRSAMPKLLEWCDEASLVRWTQDDATLPSWQDAHRRLEREGRPSKVNHPSDAHPTLKFPPPKGSTV